MGKVQEFIMTRVWVKSVEGSTVTLQDGCFFVGTEETSRTFKNVREAAIGSAKKRVLNTLAPVKEPKAPKAVKAPKAPKLPKAPKEPKSPKEPKAQKRKLIVPEENFDIPTMDSVEYTYDEEVESIITDIIGN
jgi:hypothetical protein